jgi:putative NADH-flavin reductase
MKILVVGGSGMVGSRIVEEATARGHQVVAGARNPEKITTNDNVTAVTIDATSADSIAQAASDVDAIVISVSPRNGGDPVVEANTVADAAMAAARNTGKRLVYVGGAGSLLLPDGSPVAETLPDEYRPEALGMRDVRDKLRDSDLDWTVLCPPAMIQPGEKQGNYRLGTTALMFDANGESAISAEDYADALVNELETSAHSREQFTLAY